MYEDNGIDRHLAVNGNKELGKKLVASKNPCFVELAFVESRMVPTNSDGGKCLLKKIMAWEYAADGAVCSAKESEPYKSQQVSGAAFALRRTGLHVSESSDIQAQPTPCNGAHGGPRPFENGVNNITPSGRQQLQALSDDDVAKSPAASNFVGTLPRSCCLLMDGGDLASAAVPAGSSTCSHYLAVFQMEFPLDKLVGICARVGERVRTNQKQSQEVKRNFYMVCREDTRCGLNSVKLRRQRDQVANGHIALRSNSVCCRIYMPGILSSSSRR